MYNCQICNKPCSSIKALELCLLTHDRYSDGDDIQEATIAQFRKVEEAVKWILLNRRGCVGSDSLTVEWYKADIMKLQQYQKATQRFKPFNPEGASIEEIVRYPSWETIIRARARLQEGANKRVEAAKDKGMLPEAEDLALLPTDKTTLKRRRRESAIRYNIKQW